MATKVMGCGNTICKWNNYGQCQRKSIILSAGNVCMISEPDPLKAQEAAGLEIEMQKIEATAKQEVNKMIQEEEAQARKVGF